MGGIRSVQARVHCCWSHCPGKMDAAVSLQARNMQLQTPPVAPCRPAASPAAAKAPPPAAA